MPLPTKWASAGWPEERDERNKSWVLSEKVSGSWVFLLIWFGGVERERNLEEEKPLPSLLSFNLESQFQLLM